MKTFKASDFARNPKPVYKEAAKNGAIIQKLNTNSDVEEEFILIKNDSSSIWDLYQADEKGKLK